MDQPELEVPPHPGRREGGRELVAEPGARGRAEEQPRGAAGPDRGREVVEAAQVDVPGGDGEVVALVEVVREVDEAVAVDRVRAQVVEEGRGGRARWSGLVRHK